VGRGGRGIGSRRRAKAGGWRKHSDTLILRRVQARCVLHMLIIIMPLNKKVAAKAFTDRRVVVLLES
jgi:hypothetical protein